MFSEIRQRKTNMWNLRTQKKPHKQKTNKLPDTEIRLVVARGKVGGEKWVN